MRDAPAACTAGIRRVRACPLAPLCGPLTSYGAMPAPETPRWAHNAGIAVLALLTLAVIAAAVTLPWWLPPLVSDLPGK